MNEVGTLKELNVKPGDVVVGVLCEHEYTITNDMTLSIEELAWSSRLPVSHCTGTYRLISRAEPSPKLWRDMTPEEKLTLLLAWYEGKVIEERNETWGVDEWVRIVYPSWSGGSAYRVKPAPKVEIKKVKIVNADGVTIGTGTVTTINGKPDCASIKMEKL